MTADPNNPNALVIRGVSKRFKKRTIRREYTTLKSELVNFILRRKPKDDARAITALRGIDLTVPRGKTVGILGRNGSGKSTLLKLITGIYAPTTGTVEVNGRISALLDLGAGFHPDFSGRENILINGIILGMSRNDVRARMDEIIAFSELGDFIDEPVRTYSSGMYMRLAFAVATHVDPDILIIDEILAVGDEHFSRKSMARMTEFKRQGKTIVLVTHDLGTVERWCDLAAWIDGGRIREFGPPDEIATHYREAVRLAEASGQAMTPAALAADGGALPSLGEPSAAKPPAHLRHVVVLDAQGQANGLIFPDSGCTIDVGVDRADVPPRVVIELRTAEDVLLFRAENEANIPSGGKLKLVLDRLPLTPGLYRVLVSLCDPATGRSWAKHELPLQMGGAAPEGGFVSVPHRWKDDAAADRRATG